ncbi:MAG: hypothetical protein KGO82_06065 [Bacteroidota bacterium]|nr:hypothetical protein [Bacteroidota bacterium]
MLQQIAYIMETRGVNFVSDGDLRKIFPNLADYELCNYLPAFNRDDVRRQWMFEHNNLQEFLASIVLDNLSFDRLIDVVSYRSDNKQKIKATWINTLSFFASGGSQKAAQLTDWLTKNDPETLVNFETDRISPEIRVEVFKKIFRHYCDLKIWLRSNKFSAKDLARFGDFTSIIDFLLEKIGKGNDLVTTLNAVYVLSEFSLLYRNGYKEKITAALLELLTSEKSPHDIYAILGGMSKLDITDEASIEIVLKKYRTSKNQYIRAGIYKLLSNTSLVEKYIDVYIEGLDLSRIEGSFGDRDGVNLLDERIHLYNGLSKVKTAEKLKLVIGVFSDYGRNYFYYSDGRDLAKQLVTNAIEAWKKDASMFQVMLEFFHSLTLTQSKNIETEVVRFFENTTGRWRAFMTVWQRVGWNQFNKEECLSVLIHKPIVEEFILGFNNGGFNDDELRSLHQLVLFNRNIKDWELLLDIIEQAAREKGSPQLIRPVLIDRKEKYKVQIRFNIDLLFDRETFIEHVRLVFEKIGKEQISHEDLSSFTHKDNSVGGTLGMSPACTIIWEFFHYDRTASLEVLLARLNDETLFVDYAIQEIYEILSDERNSFVCLTDVQLAVIKSWTVNTFGVSLLRWYFMQRFNVQLPEEEVLSFSKYCDYNNEKDIRKPGTIEQLERFVSLEALRVRVAQNLGNSLPDTMTWLVNAGYALRNNMSECFESILQFIEQAPDNEYKLTDALEFWVEKTSNFERLFVFLDNAVSFQLKTTAITIIRDSGRNIVELIAFLKKTMNSKELPDDNRLDAASFLVSLQVFEGFEFAANYIFNNPDANLEFSPLLGNISKFTNPSALPLLLRLCTMERKEGRNEYKSNLLESNILGCIFNIGVQNETNLTLVKAAINEFVETNKHLKDIHFLNMVVIRIEDNYSLQQSQNLSIDQAIVEWKNVTGT